MGKRGVSPVIATVLLVLIAIILATIIFFWAKTFIGEKTLKFDQAIESSCDDVIFDAAVVIDGDNANITIVNNGNVPIYGVEISKRDLGSETKVGTLQQTISNGETGDIPVPADLNLASGEEIVITPILIGLQGETKKAYPCEGSVSVQTITV
jgi:flagellin-like protein